MSGALEAKELLGKFKTEKLYEVTSGYSGGIFNGPQFVRNYVDDPKHGVPFLTTSSMLQADLSHLPMISAKNAYSKKLGYLKIEKGMTLITCSGTIGRITYARKDMEGFWSNQDIMKVVPDTNKIKPGYLYAFLSSCFGIPLIVSGTYGAIIQHIEPEHIRGLPVPRLGKIEDKAHELVQQAADLRVEANNQFHQSGQLINKQFNFSNTLALSHRVSSSTIASSNILQKRCDATYYESVAQKSDKYLSKISNKQSISAMEISISETGRLKQIFVDENHGIPFLTSREIFFQRLAPERYLSNKLLAEEDGFLVKEDDILLARSGQVGGIIGRGVWADSRFTNLCVSVDVFKISAQGSKVLPGYLYAYLCQTDVGYRQLIRMAAGSSIPHIYSEDIFNLNIPRCDEKTERKIHNMVKDAGEKRAEAQDIENQARALVEKAIESGGR
jgi:type I restriction enzyme S subunit